MKRTKQIHGFTLLEMLTAMAIIAIMIGLLIPAVGKIQTAAQVVKQRAQFNAIGIAIEAFYSDMQYYPPSSYTNLDNEEYASVITTDNGEDYTGAQKLAEALIGQDGLGFHPKSLWRSDGLADMDNDLVIDDPVYHAVTDELYETAEANRNARKGPYLEMEKANAVKIDSLYTSNTRVAMNTYVLADMFRTVKNLKPRGRTGMPILYFRADTSKTWGTKAENSPEGIPNALKRDCIYNRYDNFYGFILANPPWDTSQAHPMRSDTSIFYQRIKNPNFPGTLANRYADARPYRADSFILLSAGPDGLYGSADDVYNFDENE